MVRQVDLSSLLGVRDRQKDYKVLGGYHISNRWSSEFQTMLFLKPGRKRLMNVNYAKLGIMYNLPL